jgi:hypothetical protein
MTQIKLFKNSMAMVQKEVNDWLTENDPHIDVISTQFGVDNHSQSVVVMITYTEFDCED